MIYGHLFDHVSREIRQRTASLEMLWRMDENNKRKFETFVLDLWDEAFAAGRDAHNPLTPVHGGLMSETRPCPDCGATCVRSAYDVGVVWIHPLNVDCPKAAGDGRWAEPDTYVAGCGT